MLGKPLIARSIETALRAPGIDRVFISTDSPDIAAVARKAGAEVPFMRPAELARSDSGKFQVWQHALEQCAPLLSSPPELYVDLDCTNPLIETSDVTNAIERFRALRREGTPVDAVFTVANARRNPYFNLVEPDESGALRMCKARGNTVLSRQNAPPVYEHVAGVYVLDPAYLRSSRHLLDGHAAGYIVPEDKAFDVDSELDFTLIEFLLKRRSGLA